VDTASRSRVLTSIKKSLKINCLELLGRTGYGDLITFDFIRDSCVQKAIAKSKIVTITEYLKESKSLALF
jgi:hypothetical protein